MKRKMQLLLLLLSLYSYMGFGQIRNVTLFPNKVNVTSGTMSSSALSGFSAATYDVGNGAYRAEGSSTPYFTIRDLEVFDASGDKVGDLPTYTQYDYCEIGYENCMRGFEWLNKEIAIVPVPGSCRRF